MFSEMSENESMVEVVANTIPVGYRLNDFGELVKEEVESGNLAAEERVLEFVKKWVDILTKDLSVLTKEVGILK